MKKIILSAFVLSLFAACSVLRKKEKLGCGTDGRNVGAERIAAGDEKAIKASNKAKFKGAKSY